MKKIFSILGIAVLAAAGFTACSPDTYDGVSEANLPVAADATVNVSVDQDINQVTFKMEGQGLYPMWFVPSGKNNVVYSTQNGLKRIYTTAGTYTYGYRVANKHGISQGKAEGQFTINKTIFDFSKYYAMLTGDGTKEWKVAKTEAAHLACGPSGTAGTEWWAAQANEKAAFGVYDDVLTFTNDGKYSYDPGVGGTVYVNKDCSVLGGPSDSDFMAAAGKQEANYTFDVEGNSLYLVLPAKTLFPYIANDDQYNEPRFLIQSMTSSKMELVYDNGAIAWHYILSSGDEGFQGFNANSDCNLWKNCTYTNSFFYAPNWAQIADPEITTNGNSYTISLPEATFDQWQAQVFFRTDMTTNAATNYDFSAKFISTKDHNNVTVKLVREGDDGTFYFTDVIALKANQEYLFYKSDMAGIDMEKVTLVLDFGKNEAGTEVTLSSVDLQEHKCDGIEAPAEEADKTVYTYDSPSNLWKTNVDDKGNAGYTTFFFYAPDWAQIADPAVTSGSGTYTIELPAATFAQWQAQIHLITAIPVDADTPYDFSCTVVSTKDVPGATFKLTDTASDENFLFTERVDLAANTETVVKLPAKTLPKGAAGAVKLVLDFGGNPADTEVSVSKIIIQKTAK